MTWADILVAALKKAGISLIAYVPDISIHQATKLMEEDPYFQVVSSTREEEAIGVAVGAYAVGRRSAVFMQSSGLGNCINAIASLCIPCRTPIPFFINLRGELGEFNIAQVAMGRASKPILGRFRHSPLHPHHHRTVGHHPRRRPGPLLRKPGACGAVHDSAAP